MSLSALEIDANPRPRTLKSGSVSLGAHILFFLWLALCGGTSRDAAGITEITWIDSPERQEPYAAPAARVEERAPVPPAEALPGPAAPASAAPPPEISSEIPDIDGSIAPLAEVPVQARIRPLGQIRTPVPHRTQPAGAVSSPATAERPAALARGESETARPVALRRAEPGSRRPAIALPETSPAPISPAAAEEVEHAAQRSLAGASLLGPVAERPLLSYPKPVYPEWAKWEAVEASVSVYFIVLPDGRVKPNVQIRKTSGFQDFDQNAIDALLAWRFGAISHTSGDQWGVVTFHYRLAESGAR